MIGSQHYRTAETYLERAERADQDGEVDLAKYKLRFAEVHASLANAAAVALAATFEPSDGETAAAWRRTIQVPPHSVHG
jgi:hypothetical protein